MKSKIEHALGKATLLMRWVGVGLLVIGGIAGGVPAFATSPAYRCIRDGQTVLTDRPCDGSASPSSSSGDGEKIVVAAPTVVGEWRGQTQYQGAENGQLIGEAHTVVPVTLMFSADGKVSGSSPENGCQVLGLWAPGLTPRVSMLDVTLSGCRYAGFNRRYSGSLTATFTESSAQLALQAYTVPVPGMPVRRYDVGATLRR